MPSARLRAVRAAGVPSWCPGPKKSPRSGNCRHRPATPRRPDPPPALPRASAPPPEPHALRPEPDYPSLAFPPQVRSHRPSRYPSLSSYASQASGPMGRGESRPQASFFPSYPPRPRRRWPCLARVLIVGVIYAINHAVNGPLQKVIVDDARNAGVEAKAHYGNIGLSVLVFDLRTYRATSPEPTCFGFFCNTPKR